MLFMLTALCEDTEDLQRTLTTKLFLFDVLPAHLKKPMQENLYPNEVHKPYPCSWTGIECADERIKALWISGLSTNTGWVLAMDWLPATTRAVHLQTVLTVNGWLPERLPRNLEYLYYAYVTPCIGRRGTLDFSLLPSRMEELMVFTSCQTRFFGVIAVKQLPSPMHILWIQTESPWKAYVEISSLPIGLSTFALVHGGEPVRTFRCNRKAVLARLSDFEYPENLYSTTKWYSEYAKKTKTDRYDHSRVLGMWREITQVVVEIARS